MSVEGLWAVDMQQDRARPSETAIDSPKRLDVQIIVSTYAERVYRLAETLSSSRADAEDLTQDALLRAVNQVQRYDPMRGSVQTWLWRVVISAAQDAGRVRR